MSHTLTVPSSEADAIDLPLGEIATAFTDAEWPVRGCRIILVEGFQSSIEASQDAVTTRLPLGDYAATRTPVE
jgi:hypothetical protein